MTDVLTAVYTYTWCSGVKILPSINEQEGNGIYVFGVDEWKPSRDIYVIGARAGLLCCTNNQTELYLAISNESDIEPKKYFLGLKTKHLIYFQRDQRSPPAGQADIIQTFFLPAGTGFPFKAGQSVYFKWAAMSKHHFSVPFDIFCTLFYVHWFGSPEWTSVELDSQKLKDAVQFAIEKEGKCDA